MSNELTLARWRKSSYSDNHGACVEVADGQFTGVVPVRDSKDPSGPALVFPATSFVAFVASLKSGAIHPA
ncbi:DUF397 domain-containing protein [Kitasatospora sp. GAS204B]|uniref:DUF397 domain-containing protein n=1 Tax=unclassified Kitasatospora TaxID=2633591 RepID=UPI0024758B13|nr:DUF397 domain-containing protein [Kitasatospora sp. GAS204B]MDH6116413.1 hypothetical protein [Kitasatospora sp. GAS204B]